jgi:hypothetical protein
MAIDRDTDDISTPSAAIDKHIASASPAVREWLTVLLSRGERASGSVGPVPTGDAPAERLKSSEASARRLEQRIQVASDRSHRPGRTRRRAALSPL